MHDFVQPGDTVLTAASDYSLLSVYAVRRQDGSLTVLAINKDPVQHLHGTGGGGRLHPGFERHGLFLRDSAGQCRGNKWQSARRKTSQRQTFPAPAQTSITFSRLTRPPCWSLSPAPAKLLAMPIPPAASQFVFQLQGQAGVPYIVQSSTNLTDVDFRQHQHAAGRHDEHHQFSESLHASAILAGHLVALVSLKL